MQTFISNNASINHLERWRHFSVNPLKKKAITDSWFWRVIWTRRSDFGLLSAHLATACCSCRSRVQRRGRGVRGLRGSHRRPLPAARERALLARDLREVHGVSERAQRDVLLQGPPAVLQARLRKVRAARDMRVK